LPAKSVARPALANSRQPGARQQLQKHHTLRVTPAMEAGIADHVWSIEEIVGLLDLDRK